MSNQQPIPDDVLVPALRDVIQESGKGVDKFREGERDRVRQLCGDPFVNVETDWIQDRAIHLRKSGQLTGVLGGHAARSESDLEKEDAEREGFDRKESAYAAAWVESNEYKQGPRRECFERAGFRCQFCNRPGGKGVPLQAHHRSYKRWQKEGEADDLVCLCRPCHLDVHKLLAKQKCKTPAPLLFELEGDRDG